MCACLILYIASDVRVSLRLSVLYIASDIRVCEMSKGTCDHSVDLNTLDLTDLLVHI